MCIMLRILRLVRILSHLEDVEACWDGLVAGVTKVLCCGPGNKEAAPVQRERGCEVW